MNQTVAEMKKTVLVVEDDLAIRETLREALEWDGFEVVTAFDGRDGLNKIRQGPRPDLVLLDMMMPIMTGRQFLDAVMADKSLALIPVLVVSAVADKINSLGARDFVGKPPDLDFLMNLVARYTQLPSKAVS